MKNLIVILIVSMIMAFSLSACGESLDTNPTFAVQGVPTNRFVELEGSFRVGNTTAGTIAIIEDTGTGILYLHYYGIHEGSMTPWLKADGTPYTKDDIK